MQFSRDPRTAEHEMLAVIYYLTAFGYVDGDFDAKEKDYVRAAIARLAQARVDQVLGQDAGVHADIAPRWTQYLHGVLDRIDDEIRGLFTESVAEGETTHDFVVAKLKLRCFELFRRFDESGRASLLATVDELMMADGVVAPGGRIFRDELFALLAEPFELDDADIEMSTPISLFIDEPRALASRFDDHPFFAPFEWVYEKERAAFARQAEVDLDLFRRFEAKLGEQRDKGKGKLAGARNFAAFAGADSFLDGHVYVFPPKPKKAYELLVIGDLHGCYSCLKAALLQADFFTKVDAYRQDPDKNPRALLVLLGDYIDRGIYSYDGVLRMALQLFLAAPDDVFVLRGNHEYYVEIKGKILAPVRPSEAMNSIVSVAPLELLVAYKHLFEIMPNMLAFDRTLFVHAGIPRDDTMGEKLSDLASLNEEDIRFQMSWSDPSDVDHVPHDLQHATARFPFGRAQLKTFLSRFGLNTLIRGHERVVEGFKIVYSDPEARLLSLFSSGGATNADLPETSNYREVTPMALMISHQDGVSRITPFPIAYERYNDPKYNAFFRARLEQ